VSITVERVHQSLVDVLYLPFFHPEGFDGKSLFLFVDISLAKFSLEVPN
jgi:hypothetical protein